MFVLVQIPSDLINASMVEVRGTGGLVFTNSSDVTENLKFLTLLVQTDKATYKPGDTSKSRNINLR